MSMLTLETIYGIYCDALVCDANDLVFVSLWGRDTAIQELLAKLTIPTREGGVRELKFDERDTHTRFTANIGDPDRLDKMSGRMPKANLFGDIVHLWLFDRRVKQPDYVNGMAYLLLTGLEDKMGACWNLVKSVCHLPLLDDWRSQILKLMLDEGWVRIEKGYNLDVLRLNIPEDTFSLAISEKIKRGELVLSEPS